jgi:hypothetical protein
MPLDSNSANIQVNSLVSPQFPVALTAVATTANTNYTDTPTNAVEFLPASGAAISTYAPRGMRLTKVTALSRATVATAAEMQLFVSDAAGSVRRFINSTLMPTYTVSQSAGQTEIDFGYSEGNPLTLSAGERLWLAIGVSQTGIVARAEGGGY